jgi:hypothetical protein
MDFDSRLKTIQSRYATSASEPSLQVLHGRWGSGVLTIDAAGEECECTEHNAACASGPIAERECGRQQQAPIRTTLRVSPGL